MNFTDNIIKFFATFRVHLLAWSLLLSGPFGIIGQIHASEIQDQLNNLVQEEKDKLKNIDFSDQLQDIANDLPSKIKPNLSEKDREALKLLGYSDDEIDNLSVATAMDPAERDKFRQRVDDFNDKKVKDVNSTIKNDVIPGMASSVIGLAFSSMLGLVVGFRCHNQPSGLVFAASAGAWVALEMMIWKGYQFEQKEFSKMQDLSKIPGHLEPKINKAKKIINDLEQGFKNVNASDVVSFESYLEGQMAKVEELKKIAQDIRDYLKVQKDRQFGALRSIQSSISLAASTTRKKARNAKIAAVGFTVAGGIAAAENANLINAGGTCTGQEPTGEQTLLKRNPIIDFFLPSAHALGFANVGDFDKIGIPIGGGLAAAYLGFNKTFGQQIYNSATGRAITFLMMAGIAGVAAWKLSKAAKFLDQQEYEMDLFVSAIEDKLSGLSMSFPTGKELIDELKEKLLPEIQEIREGLQNGLADMEDKIKDQIGTGVEDLKGQINSEDLNKAIEAEKNFDASDINQSLSEATKMDFSNLDASDLRGRLGFIEKVIDFLMDTAVAKKTSYDTPVSCFGRSRSFLVEDETCQCRSKNKCNRSFYPQKMSFPVKSEFGPTIFQIGGLISKSSEAIFMGAPKKGVVGFSKVGSLKNKIDLNTRKILSQQLGKKIDYKVTAIGVNKALQMVSPALKDYYKGSQKGLTQRMNPALSKGLVRSSKRNLVSSTDQGRALRMSLRNKLSMAKALGNKSLHGYELKTSKSLKNERSYNYSKEALTRDSSKDIFQVISKRYLIIQSDGRL